MLPTLRLLWVMIYAICALLEAGFIVPVYHKGPDGLMLDLSQDFVYLAIFWSSGTGAIGTRSLRAAGKCFSLELRYADNIGKLEDDELVSSVSPDDWCGNDK